MFCVKESIQVNAPIERCFLLSTSVPLVRKILGMRPVEGKTTGLVTLGDRVLWRGWKFGLPVKHETLITGFDAPFFFQDSMASGQFREFHHDHRFRETGGGTLFEDVVEFSLPFAAAGQVVGRMVVVPHVLGLLRRRFGMLKRIAEGDEWKQFLSPTR